jgi:hypothetical protein
LFDFDSIIEMFTAFAAPRNMLNLHVYFSNNKHENEKKKKSNRNRNQNGLWIELVLRRQQRRKLLCIVVVVVVVVVVAWSGGIEFGTVDQRVQIAVLDKLRGGLVVVW